MSDPQSPITANPWAALRQFTDARIALGRSGVSLPTSAHLAFQLAHAQARDAVHRSLDGPALSEQLSAAWPGLPGSVLQLHSAATDRNHYLQRPDLGRRLDIASRDSLAPSEGTLEERPFDVAFVIADGLSALAIEQNAAPFLAALHPHMAGEDWKVVSPATAPKAARPLTVGCAPKSRPKPSAFAPPKSRRWMLGFVQASALASWPGGYAS